MGNRSWTVLFLAALAVAGTGCIGLHGPRGLQHDVTRATGVELEPDGGVTVSGLAMMVARAAVDDDDDVDLRGVRRVSVGTYIPRPEAGATLRLGPSDLPGWEPIVRVHEPGEDVLVLTRVKQGRIRGLLVVVAESDEWTLVHLEGRLDDMVVRAIAIASHEADRPDLYPRLRDAYAEATAPAGPPDATADS